MPDISGARCKDKDKCYRFTARASEYQQSYSNFAPYDGSTREENSLPLWILV